MTLDFPLIKLKCFLLKKKLVLEEHPSPILRILEEVRKGRREGGRGSGRERERKRGDIDVGEKHVPAASCRLPHRGSNPPPFDDSPTNQAIPARANIETLLKQRAVKQITQLAGVSLVARGEPSPWARGHRWGKDAADKCGQVPHPELGKEDSMTLAQGRERGSYLGTLGSDWLAEAWKGVSSISPALASGSHIWPWGRAART